MNREYKDKIDIVDYKAEDTMEYDYRNTYFHIPEKNGPGLTGNEIVTGEWKQTLNKNNKFNLNLI